MNWFMVLASVLYVLASGYSIWSGSITMGIVYLGYAIAGFAIATIK